MRKIIQRLLPSDKYVINSNYAQFSLIVKNVQPDTSGVHYSGIVNAPQAAEHPQYRKSYPVSEILSRFRITVQLFKVYRIPATSGVAVL